ncbi:hypothetical protein B0O80DRAFT_459078 [Mortierella sp. GBAus27b]|nr:hypothetical protein B0O80DRAFT_459078 [Mortierella sp. GBAus27b]
MKRGGRKGPCAMHLEPTNHSLKGLRIDARTQFWFTYEEMDIIAVALQLPEVFVADNRSTMGKIEGLCLVLHRLSCPRHFSDAVPIFGKHEATLTAQFRVITDTIHQDWKHLLLFDHVRLNPAYLQQLSQLVHAKGSLQNCWGFVDGTHKRVCRPEDNQDLVHIPVILKDSL